MSKPDKLPSLDPNVRGIFDAILRAVDEVRTERKSERYRLEEQRIAASEKLRHEAVELERMRAEAEQLSAQRYAAAAAEAEGFIPFERPPLLESWDPKFVR